MTQIKTPQQIARETLGSDALNGIGYEQYIPYMVRAIEADRTQRASVIAATASDCEVSHFTDVGGKWSNLQISDPEADPTDTTDHTRVSILLSDREAMELAAELAPQRDLYELIAEALEDRADGWDSDHPDDAEIAERQRRAAEALRNNEGDEAWDRYIGPMLDEMEEEYGR